MTTGNDRVARVRTYLTAEGFTLLLRQRVLALHSGGHIQGTNDPKLLPDEFGNRQDLMKTNSDAKEWSADDWFPAAV
ncbi:hypothetical protein [Paraburkholderia aspalathi]|jgi:hypothetical protein|uniref:Uncharacterized protein n=1 Tax=Paraburkholderia aspalathi TaxID=1324617 RepID=A0A1I7ELF1_9BURK|nr:hypothetical protein [Paraburkholderia aspalathi]SFU24778.1 hypothetical protein SAMN05192563_102988 [Paraburkholderia aspalathi]